MPIYKLAITAEGQVLHLRQRLRRPLRLRLLQRKLLIQVRAARPIPQPPLLRRPPLLQFLPLLRFLPLPRSILRANLQPPTINASAMKAIVQLEYALTAFSFMAITIVAVCATWAFKNHNALRVSSNSFGAGLSELYL